MWPFARGLNVARHNRDLEREGDCVRPDTADYNETTGLAFALALTGNDLRGTPPTNLRGELRGHAGSGCAKRAGSPPPWRRPGA